MHSARCCTALHCTDRARFLAAYEWRCNGCDFIKLPNAKGGGHGVAALDPGRHCTRGCVGGVLAHASCSLKLSSAISLGVLWPCGPAKGIPGGGCFLVGCQHTTHARCCATHNAGRAAAAAGVARKCSRAIKVPRACCVHSHWLLAAAWARPVWPALSCNMFLIELKPHAVTPMNAQMPRPPSCKHRLQC